MQKSLHCRATPIELDVTEVYQSCNNSPTFFIGYAIYSHEPDA